jgi:hypothetical protein
MLFFFHIFSLILFLEYVYKKKVKEKELKNPWLLQLYKGHFAELL